MIRSFLFAFLLFFGVANAAQPTTPVFQSIAVKPGPSYGHTLIQSNNTSATQYTFTLPLANALPIYSTSAVTSGDCPQFSGAAGLVVSIACGGGGGGSPGGSANSVQYQINGTTFGGVSLTSGQLLIGQSTTPAAETPSGDLTMSNLGVFTVTKTSGTAFGTLATLNGAPASGITGTTLASNVVTSSITTVGTIGSGLWQASLINPTYGGTGVNNGSKTITLGGSFTTTGAATPTLAFGSTGYTFTYPTQNATLAALGVAQTYTAIQTYTNNNLCMLGSSTGTTCLTSQNASTTSYSFNLPAASGTLTYIPTGQSVTNTHVAVWSGSGGGLIDGGVPAGSITVADGIGDSFPSITTVNLLGGLLSNPSTNTATYTPQTTDRVVTTCSGGTNLCIIQAGDAGNIVYYNNTGLTAVINALSSSYIPAGQSFEICNESASGTLAGTSVNAIVGYPTGGSPGAYTFSLPATQNGVMACLGLHSDATTLRAALVNAAPNLVFNNLADQALTGGFVPTAFSNGTATSGTTTVDCGQNPIQSLTNGGAFTLAMATNDGLCTLRVTNNSSAGAITFSGFSVGSNTGDALTTTSTSKFDIELTRIGGNPRYYIHALQAASSAFALVGTPVQWGATQTATSATYNTTGAAIEFVAVGYSDSSGGAPTVTDSLSNTWVALTNYRNPDADIRIFYCVSCSVGGTQTFTVTGSANIFFNAAVMAFSAPGGYAIDGSVVGNNAGVAPTIQPGSITPVGAGDLFITAISNFDSTVVGTINGSFVIPSGLSVAYASNAGFAMAYYIQPGSSAQNPTWTYSGGTSTSPATMVAFKP